MATYEEAAKVRDRIADELLDGRHVVSVGIRRGDDGYYCGVTATEPIPAPALPRRLHDVDIRVRVTGGDHGVAHAALPETAGVLGRVRQWIHDTLT